MSKGINILLSFILLPTLFLALMVGFDLNALGIIEGVDTPYIHEIFGGIGILAGVLLFLAGIQTLVGIVYISIQRKV